MPLDRERILPRLPPRALSFDGVDDYVSVPASASFANIIEITIEAFISRLGDGTGGYQKIAGTYSYSPYGGYALFYARESQKIRFYTRDTTSGYYVEDTEIIPTNRWIHYVGTYSNGTLKLYRDATIIASSTGNYTPILTDFEIGAWVQFSYYFNGYIGFVRIYNRALSDDEIMYNYLHPGDPVRDGLVLWLHWDSIDITNSLWKDKTYYGNDATIYGATEQVFTQDVVRRLTPVRTQAVER